MQWRSWSHLKLVGPVIVFLPPPIVSSPRPVAKAGSVVLRLGHTTAALARLRPDPTSPSEPVSIACVACLSCAREARRQGCASAGVDSA